MALRDAVADATHSQGMKEEDNDKDDKRRTTLILLDKDDNLWPDHGDAGFWSSLRRMSQWSKSLIVLTANTVPPEARGAARGIVRLERPTASKCGVALAATAHRKGLVVYDHNSCDKVARRCGRDHRSALVKTQLWAQTTTRGKEKEEDAVKTNNHPSTACCLPLDPPVVESVSPPLSPLGLTRW